MYRQQRLNEYLRNELTQCTNLLNRMEYDLKTLPEGSLEYKNHKFYRYMIYKNQQLHLPINEYAPDGQLLIDELRYRRYIKAARPILKKKIKAIRTLQNTNPLYDPLQIRNQLASQYCDINNLPIFLKDDFDPDSWIPETIASVPMHTEHLRHPSEGGLMTRSKSEAMIASSLEKTDLKFQYEAPTRLLYRTVRPDFKILLPQKRKFIYWEHLGRLDDSSYVLSNLTKLQDYADAGIYLGINLVITCETQAKPLTYDMINRTINKIRHM